MQHKFLADTRNVAPKYTYRSRSRIRNAAEYHLGYKYGIPFNFLPTFLKGHDGKRETFTPETEATLREFFSSDDGQRFISALTENRLFSRTFAYYYPRIEIVNLPRNVGYRPAERGTFAVSVNWLLKKIKENETDDLIAYFTGDFLETDPGQSVFMTLPEERNWFFQYKLPAREQYTLMSDIPVTALPAEWLSGQPKIEGVSFYNGLMRIYLTDDVTVYVRDNETANGIPASFTSPEEKLRFASLLMQRFNGQEGKAFVDFMRRMGIKTISVYPDNDAQVVQPDKMDGGDLCITTTAFLTLTWKELRQGIYDIYDQLLCRTPLRSKNLKERASHTKQLMGDTYGHNRCAMRVYPGQDGVIVFEKGYH